MRFRSFSLTEFPAAERSAALRAQALAWQPFGDAELRLAVAGGRGVAFAWDRPALRQCLQDAQLEAKALRLWPESLMREALPAGLRLVECIDGFEAECWVDHCLVASRWWPSLPDDTAWLEFTRGLGASVANLTNVTVVPEPVRLTTRPRPWIAVRELADLDGRQSSQEVLAWQVALLCCVGVTAATAHQFWDARVQVNAGKLELASLEVSSAATLKARDEALRLTTEATQLSAVMGGVLPLELMQHLVQILPQDVRVKELEINADKLRVGLDAPSTLARSVLIKRLQDGAWLKEVHEVKASSMNGSTVLEMRVDGVRAPLVAASAPAAELKLDPAKRSAEGGK